MSGDRPTDRDVVIPLAAEAIEIGRRTVETGRVRVSTVSNTRTEEIDVVLASTRVRVDRVPVGRFVDAMPATRTEGETVIVPVVEEVVVKRLFLREEVHLVPEVSRRRHTDTVSLTAEDVVVSRSGPPGLERSEPSPSFNAIQGEHDVE